MSFDDPPAFCCCEFIDRKGQRSHLSDCSYLDKYFLAFCSRKPCLAELLADLDDRLRLPRYNGAVHVGIDGLVPAIALPFLASFGARGPFHAALIVATVPIALALVHRASLRARRRSRFFVSWTLCSVVYGHAAFTLRIGEQVSFGWWLTATACWGFAIVCAVEARAAVSHPRASRRGGGVGGDGSGDEEAGAPARATEAADASSVRCALCGERVAGYDHHCIWIDACIGRPNLRHFLRGLLGMIAGTTVQAGACVALATGRYAEHAAGGSARGPWGLEAVLALYALLTAAGVSWLLATMAVLLARGITAHEARRLRRQGKPLPAMRGSLGPLIAALIH